MPIRLFSTFCLSTALLGSFAATASAEVTFPSDAQQSCPVDSAMLQGWFADGQVAASGMVHPADSAAFPLDNTNCDFYRWGAQMFLWLTSPDTGGSGWVFDGDTFYDVVNQGNDVFTFEQFSGDTPNPMGLRATKGDEGIGGTGQAGGGDVLMSQKGSLTYYGIHANVSYAQYLTAQKAGKLSGALNTNFPTDASEMSALEAVVGSLPAPEALVLELKTSWVEASTVAADRYLTITAEVPKFDRTDPVNWPSAGSETLTLALVGMHIAGTAQGHPEMIWSSFEHVDNAPNLSYYYMDQSGAA